ncbi:MAG: ParA family protein [Desulfobaccales bacterium]
MGVIIAIVNNKGGVGKTTAACNLAHALGLLGKRVLVVDLDPQCNATSLLLSNRLDRQHSLYELLAHETLGFPLAGAIYPGQYEGVSCLPNVPETAALEPELIMGAPASLFRLRRHLRHYALRHFDLVIIDTPPNLGSFVICALNTADFALVPVKAGSAFSVSGLLQAVRLINEVRVKDNKDLKDLRLLINQVDRRTVISRTLTEQIFKAFGKDQIFKTSIPGNTAFEQAEAAGATIFRWNANAPGARAFRELAQELLDIFAG